MEKPPCELMEVPDSRRQDPFHTLDKKPLVASQRAAGSKDTPGLGNTNGENCREKESNDRNTAKEIEQPEAATKEIRKLREEDAVERAPLDNTKKLPNWLGRLSWSWGAAKRKQAGKEMC